MLDKFLLKLEDGIYKHSLTVAEAAKVIAEKCPNLIAEKAYLYGKMHDLGKFFLSKSEFYKHPRIGYELLKEKHLDIANICAYHSFAITDEHYIAEFCKNDQNEILKITNILNQIEINDYIELIQLCDKLSGIDNYISIEQKITWYKTKFVVNNNYVDKLYQIKNKFDTLTGADIYQLLRIS